MNLRHLTDAQLISDTRDLIQRERSLLSKVLHHFREIERRRLYNGHPSLFVYAIKEFGYSRSQAGRRISAMRVLKELPALEGDVQSGAINLSQIGLAQSLFSTEAKNGTPLTTARKLEVFAALAGKTERESERALLEFARVPPKFREFTRAIGDGRNIMQIEISDETVAKIERLKGLLAHQMPNLSTAALIDRVCDLALERWNPARPPGRRSKPTSVAAIRRRVWERDGGACVVCKSVYAVEEDHIHPRSMGGGYTLENIRLLCRTCNQRAAIERFGHTKMDPYLARLTGGGMVRQKGAAYGGRPDSGCDVYAREDRARSVPTDPIVGLNGETVYLPTHISYLAMIARAADTLTDRLNCAAYLRSRPGLTSPNVGVFQDPRRFRNVFADATHVVLIATKSIRQTLS